MLRIVIVDDYKLFREGLRSLLENEKNMKVVAEGGDGEEGVELVRQYRPELLLFDVRMPRMDGVRMARELGRQNLKVTSVAVTACDDTNCLTTLSSEGVLGFVLKTSGFTELLAAIQTVRNGEPYVDPRLAGRMMMGLSGTQSAGPALALDELSPREKAVLYWIAQGESNEEVATKMLLSEKTVKNHVSHLLRKLELRDRSQAAALAWKVGLATVPPEAWGFSHHNVI
ncbi:MAG: response regulator transcription factor [Fretibacterium sp.]|nr:response regulator transcription factor [Fretibacterium sp.]